MLLNYLPSEVMTRIDKHRVEMDTHLRHLVSHFFKERDSLRESCERKLQILTDEAEKAK
jgi:hypothetical protein